LDVKDFSESDDRLDEMLAARFSFGVVGEVGAGKSGDMAILVDILVEARVGDAGLLETGLNTNGLLTASE
jgi:hypothetical protein